MARRVGRKLPWGQPLVIVQLLEFQVVPGHEAEVTSSLRQTVLEGPLPAGILMRCAGKRLSQQQAEHIVATCWRTDAAMTAGLDEHGLPRYLAPVAELLGGRRLAAFDVSASIGHSLAGARIMRVHRGSVAPESLEIWARSSAAQVEKLSARDGLICARAGASRAGASADGEVPVFAISAWRDWEAVLAATGGHIDRLVEDTDLGELERAVALDHYQLLEAEAEAG